MRLTPFLLGERVLHSLLIDSPVGEVIKQTGYTSAEWKIFKEVTRHVAQECYLGKNTHTPTANSLSSGERSKLQSRAIEQLEKRGVKTRPNEDVFYWRWHRIFKWLKRRKVTLRAKEEYKHETAKAGLASELSPNLRKFHTLVRKEIREYASKNPEMTWALIPNRIKKAMGDRVNKQLSREGIPPANDDLMAERMEYGLMTYKIAHNKEMAKKEQQRVGSMRERAVKPARQRKRP